MKLPAYEPRRSRIEIVPMIDTIFFLLVYFLIASLTMTRMNSQKVVLPESVTAAAHAQQQVIVTLTSRDAYYIDQTMVAEGSLKEALQQRLARDPNVTVIINCDRNEPVAAFNQLYDLVKQANAAHVMIATTPATQTEIRP